MDGRDYANKNSEIILPSIEKGNAFPLNNFFLIQALKSKSKKIIDADLF